MPCYTWKRRCMVLNDPCYHTPLSQGCADTQAWFWLMAGALLVAYAAKGKR